jgi:hypothetical protein
VHTCTQVVHQPECAQFAKAVLITHFGHTGDVERGVQVRAVEPGDKTQQVERERESGFVCMYTSVCARKGRGLKNRQGITGRAYTVRC